MTRSRDDGFSEVAMWACDDNNTTQATEVPEEGDLVTDPQELATPPTPFIISLVSS